MLRGRQPFYQLNYAREFGPGSPSPRWLVADFTLRLVRAFTCGQSNLAVIDLPRAHAQGLRFFESVRSDLAMLRVQSRCSHPVFPPHSVNAARNVYRVAPLKPAGSARDTLARASFSAFSFSHHGCSLCAPLVSQGQAACVMELLLQPTTSGYVSGAGFTARLAVRAFTVCPGSPPGSSMASSRFDRALRARP